ncbi:MAG: hypothetical protein K0U78_15095 [Actinomycetia bacterium]|nr:hypothetical protein [Actinomycetes bacterium]
MERQLESSVNEIRKSINCFSWKRVQERLEKEKEIKSLKENRSVSDKTLVIGSSSRSLNTFARKQEMNVDQMNDNYYFCISEKDMIKSRLLFKKILIINIYSDGNSFKEVFENIVNFNRQCMDRDISISVSSVTV